MNKLFVFVLCGFLIFSGCRTLRPINADDIKVSLKIDKSFLKGKMARQRKYVPAANSNEGSSSNVSIGINVQCSSNDSGEVLLLITVIALAAGWYWGTCRVYMTPEGYGEYKQQLYWGENKVFLPRAAEKDGLTLKFHTYGRVEREWSYKYVPGESKRLLLKGNSIEEVKVKTNEEFTEVIEEAFTGPEAGEIPLIEDDIESSGIKEPENDRQ